jgi:hypothetical protein
LDYDDLVARGMLLEQPLVCGGAAALGVLCWHLGRLVRCGRTERVGDSGQTGAA